MLLYRFMSFNEFYNILRHRPMVNYTDHSESSKSTSVGFCFMEGDTKEDVDYFYTFLSGIVDDDVCVEIEVNDITKFRQSYGVYANPCGDFFSTILRNEYCITKWDYDNMKLSGFGILKEDENSFEGKWHWYDPSSLDFIFGGCK